jgi:hypothetical protein
MDITAMLMTRSVINVRSIQNPWLRDLINRTLTANNFAPGETGTVNGARRTAVIFFKTPISTSRKDKGIFCSVEILFSSYNAPLLCQCVPHRGTGRIAMVCSRLQVIPRHRKVGDASAAGAERKRSPQERLHILNDFYRAEFL